MKNFKFLFLALATLLAGAFTSCQQEWIPGPADADNSVYLPVNVGTIEFSTKDNAETPDIDERRVAYFPVYRQAAGEELTVAIRSRFDLANKVFEPKDEEGKVIVSVPIHEAFQIAESVTFAAGATEAKLEVKFDERLVGLLTPGNMYDAEIMVKESQYHGMYGLYRKTVKIGIPETWVTAHVDYDPKSDKTFTNKGWLFDDFIAPIYGQPAGNGAQVVIEQSEARPGIYRLVNPYCEENAIAFIGGIPSDMTFSDDINIEVDASDPEEVIIYYQPTGMYISGLGNVEIATLTNSSTGETAYGKLEDGIITFPVNAFGVVIDGSINWYGNTSGLFKIVLPGIEVTDYSMAVEFVGTQVSTDSALTEAVFQVYGGVDVESYRMIVVEDKMDPTYVLAEEIEIGLGKTETVYNTYYHDFIDKILLNPDYTPAQSEEEMIEGEEKIIYYDAESEESLFALSFDKACVYTVFVAPYDKDGNLLREEIASTYFYYRAMNDNTDVPELDEWAPKFALAGKLFGDPLYDKIYNPTFTLVCDLSNDQIDFVSALYNYFDETSIIEKKLAENDGSIAAVVAEDGEDISSWISDIKAGEGQMILSNLKPNTSYTMLVEVNSIYGKKTYARVEATTAPYAGILELGDYEFQQGGNTMKIKFEPFFNVNYANQYYGYKKTDSYDGQMYLLTWEGDGVTFDGEEKPVDLQFYGFYFPKYSTIICQGQARGYENAGSLFGIGLDDYVVGTPAADDESKAYWGYYSSSEETYEYDSETMVFNVKDGKISGLETFFKKCYYYTKDKKGEDIAKPKLETLYEFIPGVEENPISVVFTPAAEETPEETPDQTPEQDPEQTPAAKRASVRVYEGNITLKAQLEATPIAATVCTK